MIRFERDYCEGAHSKVLELLAATNLEQTDCYGADIYCEEARNLIRGLCKAPLADVYFIAGGTQANATVISAALRPFQGVLSPDTGHINGHEAGAIESSGHKVLTLINTEGKISAAQVRGTIEEHFDDTKCFHVVQPGMVYISHPTECGTLYSKIELTAISEVCREKGVPLYLDGARMGYGLTAEGSDLTLPEIADLCDVFTIGGTKQGALLGEAVVVMSPRLRENFIYMVKQQGALLAKARVMGIQFVALLRDGVYFDIARRANELAMDIRAALLRCGVPMYVNSPTNQQFPIFTQKQAEKLGEKYGLSPWVSLPDGRKVKRICTSWATKEENVARLIADLEKICGPA